jgi:hypothetical protein
MKKKQPPPDACDGPISASPAEGASVQPRGGDSDVTGVRADGLLAERCLAGEVAAWEQLYAQCHEPLLVSIGILLGRQNSDVNLVDEIAARVWYALVADDGELLARYDAARGARLVTFLRALAKDEIVRHFREEVRRRNRELLALRERPRHQERTLGQQVSSLAEFLCTLTPQERVFCSDYLLAEPAAEGPYSSASIWQLSHRIYHKLLGFLNIRS